MCTTNWLHRALGGAVTLLLLAAPALAGSVSPDSVGATVGFSLVQPDSSVTGSTQTATGVTLQVVVTGPVFADPVGDTFGSSPVKPDITVIGSTLTATDLTLAVGFAGPISAPSASANGVAGFILLDTDQNPATGITMFPGSFGPGNDGLGAEFYVDLFSEQFTPGLVDVVDVTTGFATGSAPITYGPDFLAVTVPLALISNDDGLVNYGVTVGTIIDASDVARNAGLPPAFSAAETTGVPEPGSVALVSAGLLGLAGYTWLRRR